MRARRCVRVATTTEVIGEGDCTEGAGVLVKTRERVERKTTAGDAIRSAKSGSAAWRMGGAMRVVAAVVAGLDVVVGREREKGKRRAGRKQARLVLWPSSYRGQFLPQPSGPRLGVGARMPTALPPPAPQQDP